MGPAANHPRRRRGRRLLQRERGSLTLEFVLIMPVALTLMFLALQAALYYHAGSLAAAAAREGAREAAAEHSTLDAGQAAASDYLSDVAGDSLSNPSVRVARDTGSATVTVTGTSLSLLPGVTFTVTKSASAPIEQVTP